MRAVKMLARSMFRAGLSGLLACTIFLPSAHAVSLPDGFQDLTVFQNLDRPTAVRFAPDGRIFVAEKKGIIKVFDDLTDTIPAIFADLQTEVFDNWDRGLLGLAIDPGFPASPYIYVMYTVDAPYGASAPVYHDLCEGGAGACPSYGRLSRLEAAGNVMVGPEVVLLEDWCAHYASHSIGDLRFGPDGALYVSAGDGASFSAVDYGQINNICADPPFEGGAVRSQDLETPGDPLAFSGTILRVDPSTGQALPDNPLYGGSNTNDDRVVAYGLRNPFRIAVDPESAAIWAGDVGWNISEEVNYVDPITNGVVQNFGWPCFEGAQIQPGYDNADIPICENLYTNPGSLTAPFFSYLHSEPIAPGITNIGQSSVSGLAVYPEGGSYPTHYFGSLFMADYSRGCIITMFADAGGIPDPTTRTAFATGGIAPVDLEIGPGGNLYYADIGTGEVHVIRYFSSNQPPVAVLSAAPPNGPLPLTVALDASASFDPNAGDSLSFAWDLNGDGLYDDDTAPVLTNTFFLPGYNNVAVKVSDDHGASSLKGLLIVADNSPPTAFISAPPTSYTWQVGEALTYVGGATDPEEGTLPPSDLKWEVILFHCNVLAPSDCHEHFVQTVEDVGTGVFVAVDHEYPSYIEFRLTATDAGGAWWNSSWRKRRRFAFNNHARTEDLDDVPVLLRLDPSRIDYSAVQSQGQDLRFVDGDGSVLAYEIEEWNPGGVSYVWVRIPKVNGGSNNDYVWLYHGNPLALDGQQPDAVWSGGFRAVWHLSDDFSDSTGGGHDGFNTGTESATGQIGRARSFDGVGDVIAIDHAPDLAFNKTNSFTVEAWAYVPELPTRWQGIVGTYGTVSPWYGIWMAPWGRWVSGSADNNHIYGGNVSAGWHYVCVVQDGEAGTRTLYLNGVAVGNSIAQDASGAVPLYIGSTVVEPNEYFQGVLDEVRIAGSSRSAQWVALQYDAMRGAFISYGPEEEELQGLSDTVVATLQPEIVSLTFDSAPSGVHITAGDYTLPAPYSRDFIVAGQVSLVVPPLYPFGGTNYRFSAWSQGGARIQNIVAPPVPTTYFASYVQRTFVDYDFDGDGRADSALYDMTTGNWEIHQSTGGDLLKNWGWSETLPVPGDYDGDGVVDLAVYWPAQGTWYIGRSKGGLIQRQFGWSATVPVVADYDGDGITDVAVYWPGGGTWYIERSNEGLVQRQFGWSASIPVPADYDGDGRDDVAVYYPGDGTWYISRSSSGLMTKQFGWSAACPVPADYDGDGRADIAVYYPAGGMWYINRSSLGLLTKQFGWSASVPVPADHDGDGLADLSVHWNEGGKTYILESSGGLRVEDEGGPMHVPVDNQYQLNHRWHLLP